MPRISKETKEQIKSLSHKELCEIVLKAAAKEKSVYDYIIVNYLDKETGEQELFETAKSEIKGLFYKGYKGYSVQLRQTKTLAACVKRINEFTKVSTNKVLEADLLVYVLDNVPFASSNNLLGTCFTQYDSKVGQIVKRLITLVTKKLHEDYKIEYDGKINKYLKILHQHSNHLDFIYGMPDRI